MAVNLDGFTLNGTDYNIEDQEARSRIDNLVANNNPTEGNSELTDIRVGYDGKTYESAGAAIRGNDEALDDKIIELKEDLTEVTNNNFVITDNDLHLFIASENSEYAEPNSTVTGTIAASKYYSKIFKIKKGTILCATLGSSPNLYVISKIEDDTTTITFKERIAYGRCVNFVWEADEDCTILCTSNPSDTYNGVIFFTYDKSYLNTVGWSCGCMNNNGFNFNYNYYISNKVPVNYADSITVNSKASSSVYAIAIYSEDGTKKSSISGTDSSKYVDYEKTSQHNGYMIASALSVLNNTDTSIVINRATQELTSISIPDINTKSDVSLSTMIQPFMGIAVNTVFSDLPNNVNGTLEVIRNNIQYVEQRLYQYSTGNLLTRLLKVDGTAYNEWQAYEKSHIYGKIIIGVGDSLMCGNQLGTSVTWLNLLSSYGMITKNCGVNGNTVAVQETETTNKPMVSRISDIYDEVSECDYFVLIGGANDKRLNVPLGETGSTNTSEFCGALNSIIDQVRELYPKAHIIFMTNYDRYPSLNSIGLTDIDYVNAMINVCKAKHIFCYDNYHNSGVCFTDENFLTWADEGISIGKTANHHFSAEAYKWLLPKYKALIESN